MIFKKIKFIDLIKTFITICFVLVNFSNSPAIAQTSFDSHNFISDAVKNVGPAVVRIIQNDLWKDIIWPYFNRSSSQRFVREPGMTPDRERGQGSGVIIDKEGLHN